MVECRLTAASHWAPTATAGSPANHPSTDVGLDAFPLMVAMVCLDAYPYSAVTGGCSGANLYSDVTAAYLDAYQYSVVMGGCSGANQCLAVMEVYSAGYPCSVVRRTVGCPYSDAYSAGKPKVGSSTETGSWTNRG